jgi:hypothetical protein
MAKDTILRLALPGLEAFGYELIDKDENDTGNDDIAGHAMLYAARVTRAVMNKKAIPAPPQILLNASKPASEDQRQPQPHSEE